MVREEPDLRRRSQRLMQRGERMLVPCEGGPSISRLVTFPPPIEIEERGGLYVLVDDGPPEQWRYDFVPDQPSPR